MAKFQTVDSLDPLLTKQKEDVAKMRASLLSCSQGDELSAATSLRNITVLRVYHQISRIIRFIEMMDKLEEKMYESLDYAIDNMDVFDDSTWAQLLRIQTQLQQNLIESHKILQPYLDFQDLGINDLVASTQVVDAENTSSALVLDRDSRDKLRTGAQQVLTILEGGEA